MEIEGASSQTSRLRGVNTHKQESGQQVSSSFSSPRVGIVRSIKLSSKHIISKLKWFFTRQSGMLVLSWFVTKASSVSNW